MAGAVVMTEALAAAAPRLDRAFLEGREPLAAPVSTVEFAPPPDAAPPLASFEGRLILEEESRTGSIQVLRDDYELVPLPDQHVQHLPEFDFEFLTVGDALVPVRRGPIANDHAQWEYVLETGRVWTDPADKGLTRAAIPFALMERNANCVHYGLLTFLYDGRGHTSRAAYQITSETCAYLKVDMWGVLPARYRPAPVANRGAIVADYARELAARLPTRPIAQLRADYPGADADAFGNSADIAPADMTAFGFVIDGVHYVGGCETRTGPYPYCDVLDLPSYSLAKSLVGGLGTMALARQYPQIFREPIARHVPRCRSDERWSAVTVADALNMATGNFDSAVYDIDEQSPAMLPFFVAENHAAKIAIACDQWPHRTAPGTQWIYHTTDTYVLGTALESFVQLSWGPDADFYDDILVARLWEPLSMSPVLRITRRTRDLDSQTFTGWGLLLHRDDVARIGVFLLADTPTVGGAPAFDAAAFAVAMQRNPADRGLVSLDDSFRYANGFWGHDVAPYLGCAAPTWVPYMVGFGGINVVLLPNGTVYYYFSDGHVHRWARAAAASHRIRPYCASPGADARRSVP